MVEFVNREDNERWNNNAEWFRKCRQRLHDKFANCKSYLEDCERSGWNLSQGLPVHHWGLATDEQIDELAFEMAGWGITARKAFKLQFLGNRKASKMLRDFKRNKRFGSQPARAVYKEFAPTQRSDY